MDEILLSILLTVIMVPKAELKKGDKAMASLSTFCHGNGEGEGTGEAPTLAPEELEVVCLLWESYFSVV